MNRLVRLFMAMYRKKEAGADGVVASAVSALVSELNRLRGGESKRTMPVGTYNRCVDSLNRQDGVLARAVMLVHKYGFSVGYVSQNGRLLPALGVASALVVSKVARQAVRSAYKAAGRTGLLAQLGKCEVMSDIARHGLPYPLNNGTVKMLDHMTDDEVLLAVAAMRSGFVLVGRRKGVSFARKGLAFRPVACVTVMEKGVASKAMEIEAPKDRRFKGRIPHDWIQAYCEENRLNFIGR